MLTCSTEEITNQTDHGTVIDCGTEGAMNQVLKWQISEKSFTQKSTSMIQCTVFNRETPYIAKQSIIHEYFQKNTDTTLSSGPVNN